MALTATNSISASGSGGAGLNYPVNVVVNIKGMAAVLSNLNRNVRQSNIALARMQANAQGVDKSFSSFGNTIKRIGMYTGVFMVARGVMSILDNMAQTELRLAEVGTLIDRSNANAAKSFQSVTQALIRMSPYLGTTVEMTKGLYEIMSAGVEDPTDALKLLEVAAKYAKVGLTDLNTSAAMMTSVMKAYGFTADEMRAKTDALFASVAIGKYHAEDLNAAIGNILPTAAAMGVSIEEVSAALAFLSNRGLSASESATALNRMLLSILRPIEKTKSALAQLGLEWGINAFKTKTFTEYLQKLALASKQQGNLIPDIFRRETGLRGMYGFAADMPGYLRGLERVKEAEEGNGVVADKLSMITGTLNQELIALKNTVLNSAGSWLALSGSLAKGVHNLRPWIGALMETKTGLLLAATAFTILLKGVQSTIPAIASARLELAGLQLAQQNGVAGMGRMIAKQQAAVQAAANLNRANLMWAVSLGAVVAGLLLLNVAIEKYIKQLDEEINRDSIMQGKRKEMIEDLRNMRDLYKQLQPGAVFSPVADQLNEERRLVVEKLKLAEAENRLNIKSEPWNKRIFGFTKDFEGSLRTFSGKGLIELTKNFKGTGLLEEWNALLLRMEKGTGSFVEDFNKELEQSPGIVHRLAEQFGVAEIAFNNLFKKGMERDGMKKAYYAQGVELRNLTEYAKKFSDRLITADLSVTQLMDSMTPEELKKAQSALGEILKGDKSSLFKLFGERDKTGTVQSLEKMNYELVKLKNNFDAAVQGKAGHDRWQNILGGANKVVEDVRDGMALNKNEAEDIMLQLQVAWNTVQNQISFDHFAEKTKKSAEAVKKFIADLSPELQDLWNKINSANDKKVRKDKNAEAWKAIQESASKEMEHVLDWEAQIAKYQQELAGDKAENIVETEKRKTQKVIEELTKLSIAEAFYFRGSGAAHAALAKAKIDAIRLVELAQETAFARETEKEMEHEFELVRRSKRTTSTKLQMINELEAKFLAVAATSASMEGWATLADKVMNKAEDMRLLVIKEESAWAGWEKRLSSISSGFQNLSTLIGKFSKKAGDTANTVAIVVAGLGNLATAAATAAKSMDDINTAQDENNAGAEFAGWVGLVGAAIGALTSIIDTIFQLKEASKDTRTELEKLNDTLSTNLEQAQKAGDKTGYLVYFTNLKQGLAAGTISLNEYGDKYAEAWAELVALLFESGVTQDSLDLFKAYLDYLKIELEEGRVSLQQYQKAFLESWNSMFEQLMGMDFGKDTLALIDQAFAVLKKELDEGNITLKQYQNAFFESWNKMFEQLMGGDLSADNLAQIGASFQQLFDALAAGDITLVQFQENFGKAFTTLVERLRAAGMEGAKVMGDLIDKLRETGIKVKEVQDYIYEQLGVNSPEAVSGVQGLMKMITAGTDEVFSQVNKENLERGILSVFNAMIAAGVPFNQAMDSMGEALDAYLERLAKLELTAGPGIERLLKYRELQKVNKDLFSAIEGNLAVMNALFNTRSLTQQDFEDAAHNTLDFYNKLQSAGFTQAEALVAMAPTLTRLKFMQEQYGYTVDATTQALIDQADAQGLLLDGALSIENILLASFGMLLQALGVDIPYAMSKAVEDFYKMSEKMEKRAAGFTDRVGLDPREWDGTMPDGEKIINSGVQTVGQLSVLNEKMASVPQTLLDTLQTARDYYPRMNDIANWSSLSYDVLLDIRQGISDMGGGDLQSFKADIRNGALASEAKGQQKVFGNFNIKVDLDGRQVYEGVKGYVAEGVKSGGLPLNRGGSI